MAPIGPTSKPELPPGAENGDTRVRDGDALLCKWGLSFFAFFVASSDSSKATFIDFYRVPEVVPPTMRAVVKWGLGSGFSKVMSRAEPVPGPVDFEGDRAVDRIATPLGPRGEWCGGLLTAIHLIVITPPCICG